MQGRLAPAQPAGPPKLDPGAIAPVTAPFALAHSVFVVIADELEAQIQDDSRALRRHASNRPRGWKRRRPMRRRSKQARRCPQDSVVGTLIRIPSLAVERGKTRIKASE